MPVLTLDDAVFHPSAFVSDILSNIWRAENRQSLKPWFRYWQLLLTAMVQLVSARRCVYRSIKGGLHEIYSKQETVVWRGFPAWTIICRHSVFSTENQVLFPVARQFKVTLSFDSGNHLYIIQLKKSNGYHRVY